MAIIWPPVLTAVFAPLARSATGDSATDHVLARHPTGTPRPCTVPVVAAHGLLGICLRHLAALAAARTRAFPMAWCRPSLAGRAPEAQCRIPGTPFVLQVNRDDAQHLQRRNTWLSTCSPSTPLRARRENR
jgi:hypothetical protein